MRIAIIEWRPRICGATDWAIHLSYGGAALGHEVDRLTFSKSGKSLAGWGHRGRFWEARKLADAPGILDGYDLIILSDIICRSPEVDKRAIKEGTMPWWHDVIAGTRTPFTTMAHDGAYQSKYDEHVRHLLSLPNFSGVLITTRDAAMQRFTGDFPPVRWVKYPYLPYAMELTGRGAGETRYRSIIMTARINSNKGQDASVVLADEVGMNVHWYGYSPYGTPSPAWHLYELTLAMGYETALFPRRQRGFEHRRHPETHKFQTGEFAVCKGDVVLTYHGEFVEFDDIDWSPMFHLSLNNAKIYGTLEYCTLDGIAHGCIGIVPGHQVTEAEYDNIITVPFTHASYSATRDGALVESKKNEWDIRGTADILEGLWDMSDAELLDIAARQAEEIRDKHDPAVVLGKLVSAI